MRDDNGVEPSLALKESTLNKSRNAFAPKKQGG